MRYQSDDKIWFIISKKKLWPIFSGVMHVDYTVIDDYMNSSLCSKDVYFKKIPLDSIVFPPDDTIYCQLGLQDSGEPNFHGQPVTPMCDMVSSQKMIPSSYVGKCIKSSGFGLSWIGASVQPDVSSGNSGSRYYETTYKLSCWCNVDNFRIIMHCKLHDPKVVLADDDCSPSDQLVYYVRVDNAYLSTPGKVILLVPGTIWCNILQ